MQYALKLTVCALMFVSLPYSASGFTTETPDSRPTFIHKTAKSNQSSEQRMLQQQRACTSDSYFGPVATNRDVAYRNCEGKVLYGRINSAGYGQLVDETGQSITVVPK